MSDRISAIIAAESVSDGTLKLVLQAVDGIAGFHLPYTTVTLSIWRVDMEVIRMSLLNPATGTLAYFQGAAPALDLIRELGLAVTR